MRLSLTFETASKKKEQKALNSLASRNIQDLFVNNAVAMYPSWKESQWAENINGVDVIYSIIRRLVNAGHNIPIYGYEETKDGQLVDLPDTDPVAKILANPSLEMPPLEFWDLCLSLFNNFWKCPILKLKPEVGVNSGKTIALKPLIPCFLIPKLTQSYPKVIVGYDYIIDGYKIYENIDPEDIIMVQYTNPISSWGESLSPYHVIKKRLTRMEANMNNSVSQMQNGGVKSIVYDKQDEDSSISEQRKDAYYKFARNPDNVGAAYFAAGELGHIELGLKLADLESSALDNMDKKGLCNVWQVSDRLFNNDATGSEISDKNARVALYTDAVLPTKQKFASAIAWSLSKDYSDKKRIIKPDISEVPELQRDMKTMADSVSVLPAFVPNEIRAMFKLDKINDPAMDKVYIKTGYTAIDDLQGEGDLPLTGDYQNM